MILENIALKLDLLPLLVTVMQDSIVKPQRLLQDQKLKLAHLDKNVHLEQKQPLIVLSDIIKTMLSRMIVCLVQEDSTACMDQPRQQFVQ